MTSKGYFEVQKGLSTAAEVHGVPHVDPEPHGVGGDHVGVKVKIIRPYGELKWPLFSFINSLREEED